MEDKLRYVLSVRTYIEMTLLKASRVATVATIEELLKAVRELKATCGGDSRGVAGTGAAMVTSRTGAAGGTSVAGEANKTGETGETGGGNKTGETDAAGGTAAPLTATRRREILDDPKLNGLLSTLGGQVADIK